MLEVSYHWQQTMGPVIFFLQNKNSLFHSEHRFNTRLVELGLDEPG